MTEAHPQQTQARPVQNYSWGFFLGLLLCIELAYVAVEFAFNAAILNTASHAIEVTEHSVTWLTGIGQRLSGIGLGLVILTFYFFRRIDPPGLTHLILASAIVIPSSIYAMTTFHNWLLHDYLPEKAHPEELFAANYLRLLVPSIQTGLIGVEDLPIDADTLSRPESKAFLTLLAPTLLHNPAIVNRIVKSAPDIIKFQVHKMASQSNPAAYQDYQAAFEDFDTDKIYDAYDYSSATYLEVRQQKLKEVDTNGLYGLEERYMGTAAGKYRRQAQRGELRDGAPPAGLSPAEYLAYIKKASTTNSEVKANIKPHQFKVHSYSPRFNTYQVDARDYFRQRIISYSNSSFARDWNRRAEKAFNVQSDIPLKMGMTKTEFLASEWMQNLIRSQVTLNTDKPLIPGLSQDEFFARYTLPDAWDTTREHLSDLPASASDVSRTNQRDTDALASLYGPAIALIFSLFFSLLTLGKIAGHFWMFHRRRHYFRDTKTINGKRLITLISVATIVTLPMTLPTNSLARTEAIEAASSSHLPPHYVKIMRWTLEVEPLIFPLGNTLLPHLSGVWGLDQYVDPNAGTSDTTSEHQRIQTFALSTPLTIRELQRRLHEAGLNPGPIDGIIGQGTTRALRAFQSSLGLEPTGIQDAATIQALRQPQ